VKDPSGLLLLLLRVTGLVGALVGGLLGAVVGRNLLCILSVVLVAV
jgi:hypothetical protein